MLKGCVNLSRWTGGRYGVGSRIKLRYTRAIIDGIHSGELAAAETTTTPIFSLHVRPSPRSRLLLIFVPTCLCMYLLASRIVGPTCLCMYMCWLSERRLNCLAAWSLP